MIGKISFHQKSGWPPLAWLATGKQDESHWTIYHGNRVETNNQWFGEIVWDGDFVSAGFDQTDVVFGSGAKLIDGKLVFVASSTMLDRLVSWCQDGQIAVSNSIVCLSRFLNADFPPWYPSYPSDFKSVVEGPDDHVSIIQSTQGPIQLTYFYNLSCDGQQLQQLAKPRIKRNRVTLDDYELFLNQTLRLLIDNIQSPQRKHGWKLLGTLSTGFDSTTASTLAAKFGLAEAVTIRNSRGGGDDCGTPVGHALGLKVHEFERDAWEKISFAEVPFLAADAKGEDVYFSAAEPHLKSSVVFTGFSGSIWGGYSEDYILMKRKDQSGLSLTEYRLHADMINVAVPSIGVYCAEDLLDLMQSSEVQQWASGKEYDKPFCRKILTAAGVSPELVGQTKKAASVLIEDRSSFLSSDSRQDFERYLQSVFHESPWAAMNFHVGKGVGTVARYCVAMIQAISKRISQSTGSRFFNRVANSVKLSEFVASDARYRFLFPWAMQRAKEMYQD